MHFVYTLDEARSIVDQHEKYWTSNCNCREHRGPCNRSRMDVCLQFYPVTIADGSNKRAATKEEIYAILEETREKRLVPRHFRNEKDMDRVDGVCFCCDDCCGYFLGLQACIDCGVCADVRHFGARMAGEALKVDRDKLYGCGLCVDACAMKAITMVPR